MNLTVQNELSINPRVLTVLKHKTLCIEHFVTFTRGKLFCVDRPDSSVSNSEVLGLDSRQAGE